MVTMTTLRTQVADRVPAWAAPVSTGAVGLALAGALASIEPATRAAWSPGCPFRVITGLDCPGCGGTRAFYALTQGDVVLAMDHNLLAVTLLPVLATVWAMWLTRRLKYGRLGRAPVPAAAVSMGIAIAMGVFWVARNLPWWPFSWLGSPAWG